MPEGPDEEGIDEDLRHLREDALRHLEEIRKEPEIECAHCGGIPDGTLEVKTDMHERSHRICNVCAGAILRWL